MTKRKQHSRVPESPAIDVAALLDPVSFPHPITHLQLRETPISWVLLTGIYAYKIKKPVQFDFIDASTLQRRLFLCTEELRLNRRFAPDLYLDVVPIGEERGCLRIGAAGLPLTDLPLEYAVRMREFDASQELASQLAQDRVVPGELAAFGGRLAQWHQAAAPAAAPPTEAAAVAAAAVPDESYASPALIRAQALENFPPLRGRLNDDDSKSLGRLERWTVENLARLGGLMAQRQRSGRVRECHGDLHGGNIVRWHGWWVPFDCLEFEPRLRWIDVISDVAFLFMDLLSRRRTDLAYAFLSAYLEHGGDYDGLRLLTFYGVYRALVRAKVDALAVASPTVGSVQAHWQRLSARLDTAMQLMSSRNTAVILMHGVTASGKSWLSERLISSLPAVRVRSDLERKRLRAEDQPNPGAGRYSAATTQATYARLLECATSALEGGLCVLVDATFLDRTQRHPFEALARRLGCPWVIVSCTASRATLLTRLAQRSEHAMDPSEATPGVLETQLRALKPLAPAERASAVTIDMDEPPSLQSLVETVRKRLQG